MADTSLFLEMLPGEIRSAINEAYIDEYLRKPKAVVLLGIQLEASPPPLAVVCKTIRDEFLSLWDKTGCSPTDISDVVSIKAHVSDFHFSDPMTMLRRGSASFSQKNPDISVHLVMTRTTVALGQQAISRVFYFLERWLLRAERQNDCFGRIIWDEP